MRESTRVRGVKVTHVVQLGIYGVAVGPFSAITWPIDDRGQFVGLSLGRFALSVRLTWGLPA